MRSNTFEFNVNGRPVKVTVFTETGDAALDKRYLYSLVELHKVSDQREVFRWISFASVFTQSKVEGDLGFVWPAAITNAADMIAARDNFGKLPGAIVLRWVDEIGEIDRAPGDPDLAPELPEKKVETPPS